MNTGNWTQGCDPEFAMFDTELGKYVSAIPYVRGTKEEPVPLPNGGYAMRDNVAIEFGITPANNVVDWVGNINQTLEDIHTIIPEYFTLKAVPSAHFPKQQLQHPEAQEIACSPDFNAWNGGIIENPIPQGFAENTLRSFGGHLHIGYVLMSGNDFLLDTKGDGKLRVIKMCDYYHGILSTILDNNEAAIERRKIYGKAGCFRPTEYGVEYRTLSNFWCKTDTLKCLMYYLTDEVLSAVRLNYDRKIIEDIGGLEIQRIINTGDYDAAFNVWDSTMHVLCNGITIKTFEEALNE